MRDPGFPIGDSDPYKGPLPLLSKNLNVKNGFLEVSQAALMPDPPMITFPLFCNDNCKGLKFLDLFAIMDLLGLSTNMPHPAVILLDNTPPPWIYMKNEDNIFSLSIKIKIVF